MTAKWEKLEGNQGVLTVDVDASKVDAALDQAFKKVVKKVNVPGFRKGKVPRMIFEQRFGVESLYQDALDILLPEAYSTAVEETGIDPVDRPEVDIEQIEKGQNLIFKATVTVKPEVKLGEYKGLEVEEQDTEVTEEDVESELKQLQEKHAELVVVEDGEVQEGDTVVIDFEGFHNGEAFEGGKGENYSLEIGSGTFIPGFEDQLVGEKAGAEKEINVTFPEEYHAENLAGEEVTFKVKIHDIKRKELPELDDEFAKDVNEEVETLDELKQKTRERLEEQKKQDADLSMKDTLVEKATENAEIDVPEAMVTSEQDRMLQEFEQRLQAQGMNLEMYYQFSGQDENALREQMQEDAEKRVRTNLTLEAISEEENIEVSDEEANEEVEKMAEMYNTEADKIKQMLQMQGGTDALKGDLKIRKAIDLLVENSKTVAKEAK
ncbi:trigger factor [Pseudalkalibacillus caeni]|uniref:Trigger factor n=1 Tax=Exobacillus caeni TaxID=2574798 RepID=A0A5R9FC18_9BACL|nr:trigger factor [Pseudalkalibacillus caeni]TLS39208.1 trigger factor [Pseudalkalibacillus caeni]